MPAAYAAVAPGIHGGACPNGYPAPGAGAAVFALLARSFVGSSEPGKEKKLYCTGTQ